MYRIHVSTLLHEVDACKKSHFLESIESFAWEPITWINLNCTMWHL